MSAAQVGLVSVKGAPGCSSLALALGWCWPGNAPVLVGEVDPAGADLGARLELAAEPGLASLAAGRGPLSAEALVAHLHPLGDRFGLLAGCVNPAEALAALGALGPDLVGACRAAGRVGIWDCGRLAPATVPLVEACDVAVVVCGAEPAGLARTVLAVSSLIRVVRVGVVVVGGGRRRRHAGPVAEAAAVLAARLPGGAHVVGTVPSDRWGVRAAERGPARLVRRTPFGAEAAAIAIRVAELAAEVGTDQLPVSSHDRSATPPAAVPNATVSHAAVSHTTVSDATAPDAAAPEAAVPRDALSGGGR